MASHFDNLSSHYVAVPALDKGHWYTDGAGNLLIMPNPSQGSCECVAPDEECAECLARVYTAKEFEKVDPGRTAQALGLHFIPEWQRRFDHDIGYFVA
ncbi:hypothetical protein [Ralstonia pseudosolanacearum]|uniref:hypothetical protein n=1 Tax=Ralstonia pseudosolanacearum TaxID=1310165 RepID=UPI003CF22AE4